MVLVREQVVRETLYVERPTESRCSRCAHHFNATQGMFNWFVVLWNIKDSRLVEINGVDYTLYLVYLRYAATLFAAITLFNCMVMIPIYASGDPTVN
jgi:Late exocytosis, associated with Golgi transport